jgi:predicted metal-binding protein
MIVFLLAGLMLFTEHVRTVQIIGLLACGAVFGASLTRMISAMKGREKQE